MEEEREGRERTIELYCPSISKTSQIRAWEDDKLDLGTIARIFGLEPSTLKLNGHFISRGVDLISSSVTWKSLFSFFSSRGFSTGVHGSGALVVDGKLYKSGTKRSHELTEIEHNKDIKVAQNLQHEDINTPNYKKLKDNSGYGKGSQTVQLSDNGLKRKQRLENPTPFKRLRVNGTLSNESPQGDEERGNINSSMKKLPCGFLLRENMKRVREDDLLFPTSCKRTRS